jgi:hypothetical protein
MALVARIARDHATFDTMLLPRGHASRRAASQRVKERFG